MNSKAKIPFFKIARTLLMISGILFIAVLISQSWEEIRDIFQGIKLGFFVLSVLIACTGNLVLSILFSHSLGKYGCEITPRMTNKLFFYGQIAKYVPGKIWSIVLQKSFLEKAGSTGAILFSNIDLLIVSITINATIALCLILFNISFVFVLLIYVIGVIVCLIVTKTRYMYTAARFILTKFRRLEKDPPLRKDTLSNTSIVLSYCAIWFFYLTAWFLVLSVSFGLSVREASVYIAFLCLSWIVGILAFFVPAGMGVREGVFIALARYVGIDASLETLAAIAVITRLWLITQEIGGASIVFLRNLTKNTFPK